MTKKSKAEIMVDTIAQEYMDSFEHLYVYQNCINVYILTWNLSCSFSSDELNLALCKFMKEEPEILVLGFQEIEMKMSAFIAGENVDRRIFEFEVHLSIPKTSSYIILHSQHFGGISIIVFVKLSFKSQITSVASSYIPLGPLHMANKGAVAVSILTKKNSMCFLCSHLPAHQKNIAARNDAYDLIVSKMIILHKSKRTNISVLNHEYIYWMGDLNYRIEFDEFPSQLHKFSSNEISSLWELDQLIEARNNSQAFTEFHEAQIYFKPTYKITKEEGIVTYNKSRLPAWCDRILYRSRVKGEINPVEYTSLEVPTDSDHYPVVGKFQNLIYMFDVESFNNTLNKAYSFAADKMKILQPKVELSSQDLSFGSIEIFMKKSITMIVSNVGAVEVELVLSHNENIDEDSIWVTFEVSEFKIPVNGSIEITFHAEITDISNNKFNFVESLIEEGISMQIREGRLYFISLTANYVRGTLGYPLELLVKIDVPMKLSKNLDIKNDKFCIPMQVLSMTNYIISNLFAAKSMLFQKCEVDKSVMMVMEMLDRRPSFMIQSETVENVSNSFLFFLKCMPKKPISQSTIISSENFFENPFENILPPYSFFIRHIFNFIKYISSTRNKYVPNLNELVKILEPLIFSEDIGKYVISFKKKKNTGEKMLHLYNLFCS